MTDISKKEELLDYLEKMGLISDKNNTYTHYFPGGVSGAAAIVKTDDGDVLVKQAYEHLKVAAEWKCDPKRIKVENDALIQYRKIVPDCVPAPISFDEENWIMIREAVPEDWKMWKADLMDGILNWEIARKSIDSLCKVHNATALDEEVREKFKEARFFYELRISPYIEYLINVYPELREKADKLYHLLMTKQIALIHGDYSPKNILVKDNDICILDFEVAYFGNPCFDTAFFSNHFLLKAVKNRDISEKYIEMLAYMMDRYFDNTKYADRREMERMTVQTLGFLFLARVDGKSPVEYLKREEDKQIVRKAAMRIIKEECDSYCQVFGILRDELKRCNDDVQ